MATAHIVLADTLGETIQMSEATATLLKQGGKSSWIIERDDKIESLEKGIMTTYYLAKGTRGKLRELGIFSCDTSSMGESEPFVEDLNLTRSEERWIEWNAKLFEHLLRQIVARRTVGGGIAIPLPAELTKLSSIGSSTQSRTASKTNASMPLEEVKTIIELPDFDKRAARRQRDNRDVELPENVVKQLKDFITEVAEMVSATRLCSCFSKISRTKAWLVH